MRQLVYLAAVLLASCTTVNVNRVYKSSDMFDHELEPYVKAFIQEARRYGRYISSEDITARIVVDPGGKPGDVGVCYFHENVPNEILIKRSTWDELAPETKESLMFHELGHCLLYREHCNNLTRTGKAHSVMYYSLDYPTVEDWRKHRKYYIRELFKKSRFCP